MCLLHPVGMGSDTTLKDWPVKSCFQSADGTVDLYHGHKDTPASFKEEDAIAAGFNRKVVLNYFAKYYKIVTKNEAWPHWRMERACLSEQGTLPTGTKSGTYIIIL